MLITELAKKFNIINFDKATKILKYLNKFGYLNQNESTKLNDVLIAIAKFQDFIGMNVTGELDEKTMRTMDGLRCGVPDFITENASNLGWSMKNLTYYIKARDSDMSADMWDRIIMESFRSIMNVCDLNITRSDNPSANIIMDIGSGRQDQFDGPSGVLGWCELATKQSRQVLMKLDAAETWVDNNTKRGIYLKSVICHETLHGLGLTHSNVQSSLMAPYYSPNVFIPQENDDIKRLQGLYGPPKNIIPDTPIPVPPPTSPTPTDGEWMNIQAKDLRIPGWRLVKIVQ